MGLHVVGINIQPLLTVGGVSGIIVGFSAQSVMANMISGIQLVLALLVLMAGMSVKNSNLQSLRPSQSLKKSTQLDARTVCSTTHWCQGPALNQLWHYC